MAGGLIIIDPVLHVGQICDFRYESQVITSIKETELGVYYCD